MAAHAAFYDVQTLVSFVVLEAMHKEVVWYMYELALVFFFFFSSHLSFALPL
jgi:hypothetical protein